MILWEDHEWNGKEFASKKLRDENHLLSEEKT